MKFSFFFQSLLVDAFAAFHSYVPCFLLRAFSRKPLILFAAMEPAGVLLGWSLSAVLDGRMAAATGILTALASGTFIYVATVDVLLPEFEVSARDKYLKSLLVRMTLQQLLHYKSTLSLH